MKRRALIAGAFAGLPAAAVAQTQVRVAKVGYLTRGTPPRWMLDLTREVLREHGFEEGRNLVIHVRSSADDQPERLKVLAAELVELGVDVIRARSDNAARGARAATNSVPIVTSGANDPVVLGFAASLARPGGNVTGVTGQSTELTPKRLELLMEAFPGLKRAGLLHSPTALAPGASGALAQDAASRLGIELVLREFRRAEDGDPALDAFAAAGVVAFLVTTSSAILNNAPLLTEKARRLRLAAMFTDRSMTEAGALMSYGVDQRLLTRRAAEYAARILKGEKPGDLPIQQIERLELVINLRTARELGLTLPASLIARADEVIE